MNTSSNATPELPVGSKLLTARSNAVTQPFYWSAFRELWENKSIYIVPLIVAAVEVFGFAISAIGLAERRRGVLLLDPVKQRAGIEVPYDVAAMMMIFTVFIVGVFYCLDALYGWALLVSGWVRRATFLWAALPPLAIAIFEKITFNTSYVRALLKDRVFGFAPNAFDFGGHHGVAVDSFIQLTPGRYLATPGLWIGLIFAAAFVIAAIQLRRYRGPL
jgi:hypothetical protein